MPNTSPLIIEAAINGATSKEKNPHVPRTVDEIVESAFACLEAGAAIVHNHNDAERRRLRSPRERTLRDRLEPYTPALSGRSALPDVRRWRSAHERARALRPHR